MNKEQYITTKEQEPMSTLGWLGPKGTFTELARMVLQRDKYQNHIPVECASITEICERVARGEIQLGIVPIENSTAGDVKDTLAALSHLDLQITGELIIPISQNVFVKKGANLEKIKIIKTKDQAYYQSSQEKLQELFPGHIFVPVDSTAMAVRMAAEDPTIAAIGAPNAARALGLEKELDMIGNFEENPFNTTTFVVLQKPTEIVPELTDHDKTTFIATLIDKPGSLYHYLDVLQSWRINLNKIRSFGKINGDHVFLISIDGHLADMRLRKAIQFNPSREKVGPRILGSYKCAEYVPPQVSALPPIDYLVRQIQSEMEKGTMSTPNETVAIFTLNSEVGALSKALRPFAQRNINLAALDSMPTRRKMGEYAFYLACDKNANGLEDALLELSSYCTQLVLLNKNERR